MNVYLLVDENDGDTEAGWDVESVHATEAGARAALYARFPQSTIKWSKRVPRNTLRFSTPTSTYQQWHIDEMEVLP